MPVERVTMKPSDVRKSNKPIMEKRRRARINNCLNELKSLILEALKKDPSRHSKLEKADILEMTVKHLQNLQRQQVALAVAADTSVLNKYRAGFGECVGEVSRYVSHMEGVDPALRQRLLTHLSQYLKELHRLGDTGMTTPMTIAGLAAAASSSQPLQLQMPTTTTAGLLPGSQIPSLGADPNNLFRGLQLIPTRLPTGEILFLLPSQSLAATAAAAASAAALAPTKLNGPSPTVGVVSSRSSVSIAPSSLGTQLPLSVDVFSSPVSSPEPNPLSASSPSSGCSVIVDNPCSPASAVAQDMTKKLVVTKEELNIPNSSSPSTSSSEFEPLHESTISFASSNSTEVNCDDSASAKDPWRPW